jgi:hypothetical protein
MAGAAAVTYVDYRLLFMCTGTALLIAGFSVSRARSFPPTRQAAPTAAENAALPSAAGG